MTATPKTGPSVRLEVRVGNAPPASHEVGEGGFLIGSVPGCDLRLPGVNLAPVICLISKHPAGADLRKLAPVQPISVNGRAVTSCPLSDGDRVRIGTLELAVAIRGESPAQPAPPAALPATNTPEKAPDTPGAEAAREDEVHGRGRRDRPPRESQAQREKVIARQQAVERMASELADRKQAIEAEETALREAARRQAERDAELEARAEQVNRERTLVDEQYGMLTSRQQEHQRELSQRLAEIHERERKLAESSAALEKGQKQHKDDLVRLDRIHAAIEARQKQLEQRAMEVDKGFEQLQRETRDLEAQAGQMDEWHARLSGEAERLAAQKREMEEAVTSSRQRAAALEGQQATLATLRTRLEKMREELRQQELALSDQRAMMAAGEDDLKARLEEAERLRAEAANDREFCEQERRRFEEGRASLDDAVTHLRRSQESFANEQSQLDARQKQMETTATEQAAQAGSPLTRGAQLEESQQRLAADRAAVRDREAALARSEQTLQALQEQIRKRSEDLNARQQAVEKDEAEAGLRSERREESHRAEEGRLLEARAELDGLRVEPTARADALEKRRAELDEVERRLGDFRRRIEEDAQSAGSWKQALAAERLAWEVERQAALEQDRVGRVELAGLQDVMSSLVRQLPELEVRANATLERLDRAREQMREHLTEAAGYARQGRDDLEAGRRHLHDEAERVRQQGLELQVARDEHRLAVAGFRQHLAEWQGKVGEMRQSLQLGSAQLETRQAEVDHQARQAAETTARLAAEAAELDRERKRVAEKHGEMDRHLVDMREWYRKKLRDLAGVDLPPGSELGEGDLVPLPSRVSLPLPAGERDPSRAVLTMADEIAEPDRQLGELLSGLELIDSDTLSVLWAEARRQRRTLRQLLLAGGYLTLYQMALIEAGNLDGLVLGPVRVIDKLPSSPREAVYRAFDPRRGAECVLRHLAETEMQDAVRPGEFRERFGAAMAVQHENVAAVLDVFDLQGRPAALGEYVGGLASGDWPGLAAAPGAWYRLVCQAVVGLKAIHERGLAHGHLSPASFLLTREGTLKVAGLGEPPWLASGEGDETARGDLLSLGKVAAGWAATTPGGKAGKAKPLPEELQSILAKLGAGAYASMDALEADLEAAGKKVPASTAAWDRLLKHAGEAAPLGLRRAA